MPNLDDILRDFERRLSALEAQSSQERERIPPRASSAPSPMMPPAETRNAVSQKAFQPAPVLSAHPAKTENSSAGSLFGIVGICFLILAAVFFLKLTIDSGWLTPTRQVFLAALFGLACLGLPHFTRRLGDDYGALLSGTGVTILHLSWFGAYQVHHLIDGHTALLFATGVGLLTILTNAHVANAIFVLVAVSGTYLSVPLIGFQIEDIGNLSSFLLIWNLSFSALAFFLKRRDILLVSAYFAVFTVGIISLQAGRDRIDLAQTFLQIQALQFVIFATAMLAFSLLHRLPLVVDEAWALCVLLLAYYGNTYFLLDLLLPETAPWIAAGFSVFVLGIHQVASGYLQKNLPSAEAFLTFLALTLTHSLFLKITPDTGKPLFALAVAGLMALASGGRGLPAQWRSASLVALGLIGYGALLTFVSDLPLEIRLAYNITYGLAGLLVVFSHGVRNVSLASLLLGFAHLEMLCAIYRLSLKLEAGGSLFVSVGWGLYAFLVLLWAVYKKDRAIGQSAVLILAAVSLKAAIYDVLATGNLVRVLSLLAAGLLLYACGWIFNRMKSWAPAESR